MISLHWSRLPIHFDCVPSNMEDIFDWEEFCRNAEHSNRPQDRYHGVGLNNNKGLLNDRDEGVHPYENSEPQQATLAPIGESLAHLGTNVHVNETTYASNLPELDGTFDQQRSPKELRPTVSSVHPDTNAQRTTICPSNIGEPRHQVYLPQSPSEWARNIGQVIESNVSSQVHQYSGRGCFNCSHTGHQTCHCRLVCEKSPGSERALARVLENGVISFFHRDRLDQMLTAIEEKTKPATGPDEVVSQYRKFQRMDIDIRVNPNGVSRSFKLDPRRPAMLLVTVDGNSNKAARSNVDPIDDIVHDMWADEASAYHRPLESVREKMEFVARKFISLWTLASKLGAIDIVVPCFDEIQPTAPPESNNDLGAQKLEVMRKRKLVAFEFLSSLLHCLHAVFVRFIRLCDAMAYENHGRSKPTRVMRYCLRAVIHALDNSPLDWGSSEIHIDPALEDLRLWLHQARIDLKHELALFECYSGHVIKTHAVRAPHILSLTKETQLRYRVQLITRTTDRQVDALRQNSQPFSSPRSLIEILSSEYIEADPRDTELTYQSSESVFTDGNERINRTMDSSSTACYTTSVLPISPEQSSGHAPTQTDITSPVYSHTSEPCRPRDLSELSSRERAKDVKRAASSSPPISDCATQHLTSSKRHCSVHNDDGQLSPVPSVTRVTDNGNHNKTEVRQLTSSRAQPLAPRGHNQSIFGRIWSRIKRS